MIISRTSFRLSFVGGGSDFYDYYKMGYGAVVSTTINKYVYLSMHPLFAHKGYHLKYYDNEIVDSLQKIRHPIIKEVFRRYNITGVDFNSSSDVPSGTGLGSSSSFTVGLIKLCREYVGYELQDPLFIATEACDIEINSLNSPIGIQDQFASAYGGLNYMQFNADMSVNINKITLSGDNMQQLQDRLVLLYLGDTRQAKSVLAEQKINIPKNLHTLDKMVTLADYLRNDLTNNNIDTFGEILDAGWQYKKELSSNVSNGAIDNWYKIARENGATGGKLCGAGDTGFLLLYVPEGREQLLAKMRLYELPFKFKNEGCKIVYNA